MSKVAARLKAVKAQTQTQIGGVYQNFIPAGKATGGPPLGTDLGKLGVNIPAFVKDFNDKTKHFKEGLPIGVEVEVNPDRSYQLMLSTPSLAYFLFQAAGIYKGSRDINEEIAGMTTVKHCYEIAKIKQNDFYLSHKSLQEITQMVVKAAVGMGIQVQNEPLDPKLYREFLVKRKAIVDQREEEARQLRESRLLRLV